MEASTHMNYLIGGFDVINLREGTPAWFRFMQLLNPQGYFGFYHLQLLRQRNQSRPFFVVVVRDVKAILLDTTEPQALQLWEETDLSLPTVKASDLGIRVEIESTRKIRWGDPLRVRIQQISNAASRQEAAQTPGISADEWGAFSPFIDRVIHLGGDAVFFQGTAGRLRRNLIVAPEIYLDAAPPQAALLAEKRPLQLGPGNLYHGISSLYPVIRSSRRPARMDLTRNPQAYALLDAFWRDKRKDPAILVIRTETFNRYLQEGTATLEITDEPDQGRGDSWFSIAAPGPFADLDEIWVSQDTLRKYQALLRRPNVNPDFRRHFSQLIEQDKFRIVPGIALALPMEHVDLEVQWEKLKKAVSDYLLERKLYGAIPIFEPRSLSGLEEETARAARGSFLLKNLSHVPLGPEKFDESADALAESP